TLSYQWQFSTDGSTWSSISGATASTYTLGETDEGHLIRVNVTSTDSDAPSSPVTAASIATAAVSDITLAINTNTIGGTAKEGQVLTSNATTNDADATLSYQWQFSTDGSTWSSISGA